MAIKLALYGNIKVYTGLSTDTKPTGVSVRNGSLFVEIDTKKVSVYYNNTWLSEYTSFCSMATGGANLADSTYYSVLGVDGTGASAYNSRKFVITSSGVIKNLRVNIATAPGTNNSHTITLYKNGTSTPLAVTISGTSTSGSNTTDAVSVSAGDTISLFVSQSGTPTGSGNATISFEYVIRN